MAFFKILINKKKSVSCHYFAF